MSKYLGRRKRQLTPVDAALSRQRIPGWALPLVAAVPIWAVGFAGTMQQPPADDPLFTTAADLYVSAGCAGCHGATGGGEGAGYQLSNGSLLDTFPEPIDQIVHVARGSAEIDGQPYGADRDDGRRIAGALGTPMPAHDQLTLSQLELIVFHERVVLSGEDTSNPQYQDWMQRMRVGLGSQQPVEIDLQALLACANPDTTPGATGPGKLGEPDFCPGPRALGSSEAEADSGDSEAALEE